ncbi:MAG: hypothetical protein UX13_C0003G0015 [Candidatus Woesebacteria bacterium GW2011_GWB1_45_5]|uniref:Uncharacterized protein n=1 Tax=Candidatus Woesebacteria bacterium GW2011_GWB1_45_5 TaxID=1618581 RepID=A0A0G1PZB2_9BACT|nr:MAG: hypothetical protein UX13_C0003G0015 [Candidatus Woesebacteria bacterium GW2011_GWB1_45_5]
MTVEEYLKGKAWTNVDEDGVLSPFLVELEDALKAVRMAREEESTATGMMIRTTKFDTKIKAFREVREWLNNPIADQKERLYIDTLVWAFEERFLKVKK